MISNEQAGSFRPACQSESESVETDLRGKLIKLCSTLFRCHEVHDYLVENLKQLIGQVAAKLRSLRKPEPYKGKGIKFVGEQLRRKAGKSAGAK